MKKINIKYGIFLGIVFLLTIGVTYAFFEITVTGNEEAKQIDVSTTTLSVLFTDGPELRLNEVMPGNSVTKTFTVLNDGDGTGYYKVNFQEFYNEIVDDELTVSMTCKRLENGTESGKCNNLSEEALYNRDLKNNVEIEAGITHEYTITIKFIDTNQNQNVNQGKSFAGVLQIEESNEGWEKQCEDNNSLRCKILTDNTVYRDDESSEYVTEETGVNFAKISSPTNGQGLYTNNKLEDGDNYYFRGGSFCAYEGYLNEDYNGTKCKAAGGTWSNYKCSYDLSKEACNGHGQWYELKNNVSFGGYMWKIIRIDENGEVRLLYNGNSTTSLGTASYIGTAPYNEIVGDSAFVGYMQPKAPSEYQMSSGVRTNFSESNSSYKMSKTYSYDNKTGVFTLTGDVVNGTYTSEYIGYYTCISSGTTCKWLTKIEEVDKNGTTNRIKKATVLSSKFTTSKAQAESNEINSKVKEKNDNWYKTNLESVDNKISKKAGYCNDRRTMEKDGGIGDKYTTFAATNRIYTKHTPSYKCSHESNDLFTTSEATNGNKKLTYPVGLITSDELSYAGSLYYNYNFQVYAHSGAWQWTMSPAYFSGGLAFVSYLSSYGHFSDNYVYSNVAVRPVVSLTSSALVTGGEGSLASPYVVE